MSPPPVSPSPFKVANGVIMPRNSANTQLRLGSVNTTEGTEIVIFNHQVENDAGETITSYKKTIEFTDETDTTEDVVVREYALVGGSLGLLYSSKVYAAAPTGDEAPVYGCRVLADRATWDPASKTTGGAYWVWYQGASWVAIDSQAS